MDLIDKLKNISESIPKQIEHIETEEATKNAFVMPFLNALGYNVFDPTEVVPEFTADVGTKKGEKVDYAIMREGQPTILIECKPCGTDLDKEHASQLYRYFSVTPARFGVLTNGIILMITGAIFFGMFTASLATWLVTRSKKDQDIKEKSELTELKELVIDMQSEIKDLKDLIKKSK